MRLDKFVLRSTALTKAQVITAIEAGQVCVNHGVIKDVKHQVHENNLIQLNHQTLTPRPFRYLLLHKSADKICSNVDGHYPSLFNDIDIDNKDELHIVGRLDADTTGLVLITDDGRWSFNITRPEMSCAKLYRVSLAKPLSTQAIKQLEQGILLDGETKPTLPAKITTVNERQVLLSITEGRYHQVKRMFFAVGNKVTQLHREQIGEIKLNTASDQWRYLTEAEVNSFNS
ncbi:pseudouridine synthase [Shewanella sp. UCD-KL21]|uniref:pseudouridine synthase n=1 Tax=Shewanella sp. UCD-KL21 TaxID=1917164 RepID=UPI0009703805|nr:pseudouridine synthase [Shewanella sp. UCD-KL21]